MGLGDKISNKAKETVGKFKEKTGDAIHNQSLRTEGLKDRAAAAAKEAGEQLKEKVRHSNRK
ncbi:CsbD family protein [Arthrobacter sp. AQ5-05]|uniref:CsbD family protein n=1 Tax=Arthrobacter sp. AQ5-05 TaxID=2184581 RepID=UPI000DCD05C4|nr:CsbD family protein [Arthrobacter sp. AQ5-05]RAX47344.1 CsbD family protein [Arthrobacter sp. AQ5-05]